jgi:hypothetical protein
MLIPPPPGILIPPPGGGPIAVEPPPAQPANKRVDTAIATLMRSAASGTAAVFVRFIVIGLTDI